MHTIATVADGETIKHKGDLTVDGTIGSNAVIEIEEGSLIVKGMIENSCIIHSDADINAENIGDDCIIESKQGHVSAADIGERTKINARDTIAVKNAGAAAQLSSSMGKVKIQENSANKITISARDGVRLNDIGDHANIHSSMGAVSIRNIGVRGVISARDGIDFNGSCLDPNSLNLTSSMGHIRRPQQAMIVVVTSASSSNDANMNASSVTSLNIFPAFSGTIAPLAETSQSSNALK